MLIVAVRRTCPRMGSESLLRVLEDGKSLWAKVSCMYTVLLALTGALVLVVIQLLDYAIPPPQSDSLTVRHKKFGSSGAGSPTAERLLSDSLRCFALPGITNPHRHIFNKTVSAATLQPPTPTPRTRTVTTTTTTQRGRRRRSTTTMMVTLPCFPQ